MFRETRVTTEDCGLENTPSFRLDAKTDTFAPNSGVPPALILAGLNAYNLWSDHWEHWSHMPPLEERTEYPFQNIRTRNFPWGDGDKVRLSH